MASVLGLKKNQDVSMVGYSNKNKRKSASSDNCASSIKRENIDESTSWGCFNSPVKSARKSWVELMEEEEAEEMGIQAGTGNTRDFAAIQLETRDDDFKLEAFKEEEDDEAFKAVCDEPFNEEEDDDDDGGDMDLEVFGLRSTKTEDNNTAVVKQECKNDLEESSATCTFRIEQEKALSEQLSDRRPFQIVKSASQNDSIKSDKSKKENRDTDKNISSCKRELISGNICNSSERCVTEVKIKEEVHNDSELSDLDDDGKDSENDHVTVKQEPINEVHEEYQTNVSDSEVFIKPELSISDLKSETDESEARSEADSSDQNLNESPKSRKNKEKRHWQVLDVDWSVKRDETFKSPQSKKSKIDNNKRRRKDIETQTTPRKGSSQRDSSSSSSNSSYSQGERRHQRKRFDSGGRRPKVEYEHDQEVLKRRQKQIDYGKNTIGYDNYVQQIPKDKREKHHPRTPPKHVKYSRRAWDGMIRIWRQQLHLWDPQQEDKDAEFENFMSSISVELDGEKPGRNVRVKRETESSTSSYDTAKDSVEGATDDASEEVTNMD